MNALFRLMAFIISGMLFSCNGDDGHTGNLSVTDSSQIQKMPLANAEDMDTTLSDSVAYTLKMQEFSTPGPEHKLLESLNGSWVAGLQSFSSDTSLPVPGKATITQKSELGGRFFHSTFSGIIMGQPFEEVSISGFNNAKKQYHSILYNNRGTGFVFMEGHYNHITQTFTWTGTQTDLITGGNRKIKKIVKINNKNAFTLILYETGSNAKERKVLEGIFTKRKHR